MGELAYERLGQNGGQASDNGKGTGDMGGLGDG